MAEPVFFRQVRRLGKEVHKKAPVSSDGCNILLFATRQDRNQLAIITTLAHALQRRGHTTSFLGCDRALDRSCNYGHYPTLDKWKCRTCHLYAKRTHSLTGIPIDWLSSMVPSNLLDTARELVDGLNSRDYSNFTYKGLRLGHMVRHSVANFLRTDKITSDDESLRVYKEWLISGVWLVEACDVLLDRRRPDVVVLLNGLFAPEWIMLECAKRRGLRVVTWEVGFLPETFFFQHDRPTDMCDNNLWDRFRDIPLTAEENERLDQYQAVRETGGGYLLNYFPAMESSEQTIVHRFGIDVSKKMFVLFPNITWDSTLFEKNVGFSGMADWIEETIKIVSSHPEAQLVVRVHPAEVTIPGASRDSVVDLIGKRFPRLPSNVIIIPPTSGASSYVFMKLAVAGLVYGSTTGLEMGVRGIPVIVAGKIYYRGLGFTYDAATRSEYRNLIEDVLSGKIPMDSPARKEAWRRYAYFALFRAAMPIRQVWYPREGVLPKLRYEKVSALANGKDQNLDIICDGITKGMPFLAESS